MSQHEVLPHEEDAAPRSGAHDVVIYWRPGCPFCMTLKMALRDRGDRATWHNIWEDPDAAAFVRSVNDGNETVPTVVIDGVPQTNPNPLRVRKVLGG